MNEQQRELLRYNNVKHQIKEEPEDNFEEIIELLEDSFNDFSESAQSEPEKAIQQNPVLFFKLDNSLKSRYKTKLKTKFEGAKLNLKKYVDYLMENYRHLRQPIISKKTNLSRNEVCKMEYFPEVCPDEISLTGLWTFKLVETIIKDAVNSKISRVEYSVIQNGEEILFVPEYIEIFIEELEKCLNEKLCIQKNTMKTDDSDKETQFKEIQIHSNNERKFAAILFAKNVNYEIISAIRGHFEPKPHFCLELNSLHIRDLSLKETIHLCHNREHKIVIDSIELDLVPNYMNRHKYINDAGLKLVSETIYDMIQSLNYEYLLTIGSEQGLIPLLLSKKFKVVHGITADYKTEKAGSELRTANGISNVVYSKWTHRNEIKQSQFDKKPFIAVIDNTVIEGQTPALFNQLHAMRRVKHILIVSRFEYFASKHLDKLFEDKEYFFVPTSGRIIDVNPNSNDFRTLILLERFGTEEKLQDMVISQDEDISGLLDDHTQQAQYVQGSRSLQNLKSFCEKEEIDKNRSAQNALKASIYENIDFINAMKILSKYENICKDQDYKYLESLMKSNDMQLEYCKNWVLESKAPDSRTSDCDQRQYQYRRSAEERVETSTDFRNKRYYEEYRFTRISDSNLRVNIDDRSQYKKRRFEETGQKECYSSDHRRNKEHYSYGYETCFSSSSNSNLQKDKRRI